MIKEGKNSLKLKPFIELLQRTTKSHYTKLLMKDRMLMGCYSIDDDSDIGLHYILYIPEAEAYNDPFYDMTAILDVKEILSLHPDYVVIQCGTNDLSLFNGASAIAGIDSSATMDEWIFTETPITLLKNGSKTTYYGLVPAIREMVNLALDNGV